METIESINNQLIDLFGIDTVTGQAIWRISWSEDQYEKRLMDCTPEGVPLIHMKVFLVRKYSYIKERYVLERLVVVPEMNIQELAGVKLSYEPVWVFHDPDGNYLVPTMLATKFVVDTVYAAIGKKSLRNYIEPTEDREKIINAIQEELFGNDTDVSDALTYGEGIVVPSNYNSKVEES